MSRFCFLVLLGEPLQWAHLLGELVTQLLRLCLDLLGELLVDLAGLLVVLVRVGLLQFTHQACFEACDRHVEVCGRVGDGGENDG